MAERDFQSDLIVELKEKFPDCIVMKNDSKYIQGIPDLLVLWGKHWAALECKKDKDAPFRPNQPYYIAKMNQMSFAAAIYPDNKEEVLHDLERAFRTRRSTRTIRS